MPVPHQPFQMRLLPDHAIALPADTRHPHSRPCDRLTQAHAIFQYFITLHTEYSRRQCSARIMVALQAACFPVFLFRHGKNVGNTPQNNRKNVMKQTKDQERHAFSRPRLGFSHSARFHDLRIGWKRSESVLWHSARSFHSLRIRFRAFLMKASTSAAGVS